MLRRCPRRRRPRRPRSCARSGSRRPTVRRRSARARRSRSCVTGTATDGRTLATPTSYRGGAVWSEEHGLPWQRFQISSNVGSITPAAMFAPPPSIFTLAETSAVQLHAVDLANPQLTADLQRAGRLSLRPDARARAVSRARRARTGSAGQQGGMGGQVQISVGRINTHAHGTVIFARVDSALGRTYYLLQPGGGALVVDLSGGEGGAGGEGMHAQVEYRDTDSQGRRRPQPGHVPGSAGPGRRRWSGRQRGDPRRRGATGCSRRPSRSTTRRCRRGRRRQRSRSRCGAGGWRSDGPGRSAAADLVRGSLADLRRRDRAGLPGRRSRKWLAAGSPSAATEASLPA